MGATEAAAHDARPTRIDWPSDPSIVWWDLTGTGLGANESLAVLEPSCPGITTSMIENLMAPDEKPAGQSYEGGEIRLASTFAVFPERRTSAAERGEPRPVGTLVIQPVELLASADWLVTCWHPTRTYRGMRCRAAESAPGGPAGIRESVEAAWARADTCCAADLGILIMNELALTYAPAHRAISGWLEDWELGFYIDDPRFDRDDLAHLWGERAVLRDWLVPLNRPGITENPAKAWLPASNQELVEDVDNRVDRALINLEELGNSLRASFSLLHVQQTEESRQRSEALQRRAGIAAAAFLVPTLVVGFYGANTWVPGQGEHWGFWAMVCALLAFTALTIFLLVRWQQAQRAEEQRSHEERERMRRELFQASDVERAGAESAASASFVADDR